MIPGAAELQAELVAQLLAPAEGPESLPHRQRALRARLDRQAAALPAWVGPLRPRLEAALGAPLPADPPVGEALGVVVVGEQGRLVRVRAHLEATPGPDPLPAPPGLSAEALDALHRAVGAVAALYPVPWFADPARDLRFEVLDLRGAPLTLPAPVVGGSLGAAGLLAVWSALVGQPPAPGRCATGALGLPPRGGRPCTPLLEVGDLGPKAAEAAAAGLELLQPGPDLPDAAALVARAFPAHGPGAAGLPDPPRFDPGLALELTELAYLRNGDGASWATLAARYQRLAAALPAPRAALARARAGACLCHQGRAAESIPLLQAALAACRADTEGTDAGVEIVTATHLAVSLRDLGRFAEAEARLREAIALGRAARRPVDRVNAESTLGQLLVAIGRVEEGLPLVRAARDFYVGRGAHDCPRNHTYLVTALGRAGRFGEAEEEWAAGVASNARFAEPSQRRNNRAYLDLARLDGRLRGMRDGALPADPPAWDRLLTDAEEAHRAAGVGPEGQGPWPAAGLARVRAAAQLRVSPHLAPQLWAGAGRAAAQAAAWGDPESAWQLSAMALEAALVGVPEADGWVEAAAARALATSGGHLRPWVEAWRAAAGPGRAAALRAWLAAGQY